MPDTKERKIKVPSSISFSHWPEQPYRWMMSGLVRVIEEVEGVDANYLVALGLVCYTEVMGHKIREFKKLTFGQGYSKVAFDTFLGEYMGYRDLLIKHPDIYDWFRCGLCHEYVIKNINGGTESGVFHFVNINDTEKDILEQALDIDVSLGIIVASNGKRLLFIESYLRDFKNGIEKFLKESNQI